MSCAAVHVSRYTAVFDALGDGIVASDASNRILYVNPATERMLGWSRSELLGKPLTTLMPERLHAAHEAGFRRYLETHVPRIMGRPVRVPALHRDGSEIDVELTLSSFSSEPGYEMIIAALRDLRERVELERQLAVTRYMRAATELAARITGQHDVEHVLRTTVDFLVERFDAVLARICLAGSDGETTRMGANAGADAQTWCELKVPIVAGNQPLGEIDLFFRSELPEEVVQVLETLSAMLAAAINDARLLAEREQLVAAQKRTEEAWKYLAEASAVLGSSLDFETTLKAVARLAVPHIADWCTVELASGVGSERRQIAVAHVDPEKVALADRFRRRWPPDPNAARSVPHVMRTGEAELWRELPTELLESQAQDAEHLEVIRALNLRSAMIVPLLFDGKPFGAITFVSAESGRHFDDADLILAKEIARRASLAVENARLFREAQQAIHHRDEFLSVAAHELRTPVTTLRLHIEIIERMGRMGKAISPEKLQVKLEKIIQQMNSLQDLIDTLLDITRVTHGRLELQRESVDLGALVREVVGRFAEGLEVAGCAVALDLEPGVRGDWDKLRLDQVVSNLLTNAMKYGKGRTIEIAVRGRDGHASMTVIDHGIGVPAGDQERIFGRFERAVSGRHYGGMGLGLWISRQIVEAHGGRITVASAPGEGAAFTVELPSS